LLSDDQSAERLRENAYMTDFRGRVALVTGGASGNGEATAHTFARAGATVVIADRDTERSPLVEKEIRAAGGDAHSIITDVREVDQVGRLVSTILERWGRIDVVDNNAAALELCPDDMGIIDLDPNLMMEIYRGNVVSMAIVTKAVLPTMLAQGKGSIVNMASISGMRGEMFLTSYGVSKAAIIQLTRQIAAQHGKDGIRCNAVAPSYTATRNNETYSPKGIRELYERNIMQTSVTTPQDIADVVFYLGSDESGGVTGQVIPVDGGMTASQPTNADYRDWIDRTGGIPKTDSTRWTADRAN
jgi:NAD(P)-dependent dehydrogenase (short-subunit alcohol dehydrogenase family)